MILDTAISYITNNIFLFALLGGIIYLLWHYKVLDTEKLNYWKMRKLVRQFPSETKNRIVKEQEYNKPAHKFVYIGIRPFCKILREQLIPMRYETVENKKSTIHEVNILRLTTRPVLGNTTIANPFRKEVFDIPMDPGLSFETDAKKRLLILPNGSKFNMSFASATYYLDSPLFRHILFNIHKFDIPKQRIADTEGVMTVNQLDLIPFGSYNPFMLGKETSGKTPKPVEE